MWSCRALITLAVRHRIWRERGFTIIVRLPAENGVLGQQVGDGVPDDARYLVTLLLLLINILQESNRFHGSQCNICRNSRFRLSSPSKLNKNTYSAVRLLRYYNSGRGGRFRDWCGNGRSSIIDRFLYCHPCAVAGVVRVMPKRRNISLTCFHAHHSYVTIMSRRRVLIQKRSASCACNRTNV